MSIVSQVASSRVNCSCLGSRMLRRLIVMRHAKSSWKSSANTDHARPLNARGQRDAPRVGQALLDLGWAPALVHLSDARRTRETWAGLSSVLPTCPVVADPSFYLAGLKAIKAAAAGWPPNAAGPILVLGHNPGWEEAASKLCGQQITMTTGNAVLLHGEGASWTDALAAPWKLERILLPRTLHREES